VSVLLADRRLGIRRRGVKTTSAYGQDVLGPDEDPQGPWPGRARERGDGSWSLGVDSAALPVRVNDVVWDADSGQEWLVAAHEHLVNAADDTVDYLRIEARLRTGEGQTEVAGAPERK